MSEDTMVKIISLNPYEVALIKLSLSHRILESKLILNHIDATAIQKQAAFSLYESCIELRNKIDNTPISKL